MVCLTMLLLAFAPQLPADAGESVLTKRVDVNIPPGPLASAVIELSRQSGTQIQMSSDVVKDLMTQGVSGQMSLAQALRQLLEGTALGFHPAGANTIGIDAGRSSLGKPRPNPGGAGFSAAASPLYPRPPAQGAASDVTATIPVAPVSAAASPAQRAPDSDEPPDGVTQLDTIEVTASKRLKSQRDIPGSVGALRGEELEKINAQGMEDYLKRIPGVSLPGDEPDRKVPIIRGIASDTGTGGFSQLPTGIYADDMPFTDVGLPLVVPDMNPFDLERVEVLKGPQGTLYGSGALAGLIRFVLQKPKPSVWEGKLQTTISTTQESESPSFNTGAAINIPLFGDKVAIRAVGVYLNNAGVYDERANPASVTDPVTNQSDLDTNDYDSSQQLSGRLLASWQVSDQLKLSGLYFQQNTDLDDVGQADNRDSFTRDPQPFPFLSETGFTGGNISAVYDFDFGTLLSSTNRVTKKARFRSKGGLLGGSGIPEDPNNPGDPANPEDTSDVGDEDIDAYAVPGHNFADILGYTQEFRLTSPAASDYGDWEWLGGAAYQDYDLDYEQEQELIPAPATPADGAFPIPTPIGGINGRRNLDFLYITLNLRSYEYAVFGEATRSFGEHWEATAGGRAFEQGLTGTTVVYGVLGNAATNSIENTQVSDYVERGFTPRFALRYKHDANLQTYALVSKGYQFGGVQLNPAVLALRVIAESNNQRGFQNYASSGPVELRVGFAHAMAGQASAL